LKNYTAKNGVDCHYKGTLKLSASYLLEYLTKASLTVKELLNTTKIAGDYKNTIKNFLKNVLKKLEEECDVYCQKYSSIDHEIERARRTIDNSMFKLENLLKSSEIIPLTFQYFFFELLNDLKSIEDMSFMLCLGPSLSAERYGIQYDFSIFNDTSEYINQWFRDRGNRAIWTVKLPRAMLENPLSWPLVIHEIFHCLEIDKLKIIDRNSSKEISDRDRNYLKEHESDVLSVLYFGPAYLIALKDDYVHNQIYPSPTHPMWKERIEVIYEYLKRYHFLSSNSSTEVESLISRLPSGDRLPKDIPHFDDVINRAINFLGKNKLIYDPSLEDKQINIIANRLSNFIVCTCSDVRVLLNTAHEFKGKAIENAKNAGLSEQEANEIYKFIIFDSIRLSYLYKHRGLFLRS